MEPCSVITGAGRGIGMEWVRQLQERGANVVACTRGPSAALESLARGGRVEVLPLDVGDEASIRAFAARLGSRPVELLVNNAGIIGAAYGDIHVETQAQLLDVYRVNAAGPLLLTRALLPNLRAARNARVVHVTSTMGSLGDGPSGGTYAYRMSKAALNMMCANLAADFAGAFTTAVLCPGWVQTDMGGRGAPTTPAESVRGMLRVVDRLDASMHGGFFNFRGERVPW